MISLDWKERLKIDTLDFYQRKLPLRDYDIDIIYNAYPERIDSQVPHAVITLVGKILASIMVKDADKYTDFFEYILKNKGENGSIIFAYIMARALKKNPDFFMDYIQKVLYSEHNQKACNLIMDKAMFPFLKKAPLQYLDIIMNWTKKNNSHLMVSIQKLLIKLITSDPKLITPIFRKLETSWLYANQDMIKLNTSFLRSIYKTDRKFYLSVFNEYRSTRNPVFAQILSGSICCYDKKIAEIVDNWTHSGNIRLKKIGLHSQKILSKKGR